MPKRGFIGSAVIPATAAFVLTYVAAAGIQAMRMNQLPVWTPAALPQLSQEAIGAPLVPGLLQAAPARAAVAAAPAFPPRAEDGYYAQLRSRINWVETRFGKEVMKTPDLDSRMLLARSAAQRAGLSEVGLTSHDVYGIINAETSWVPRLGASKDGTPNLGIAQFEPATARALGLRDPNDLVEAVHVAAQHMKEAALWSAARVARLKIGGEQRAAKLREGVSIYYNLSSKGRSVWNGRNTGRLPVETRQHIANARIGAQQAVLLDAQIQARAHGRGKAQSVASAGSVQGGE